MGTVLFATKDKTTAAQQRTKRVVLPKEFAPTGGPVGTYQADIIFFEELGAGAFGINMVCDAIIRRCTKTAMKHAEIARCATDKLNSIHKQVSGGLRDANISAEEFDRILEEETQYQETKEVIRSKSAQASETERNKKRTKKAARRWYRNSPND